jgi:hypothetical protein
MAFAIVAPCHKFLKIRRFYAQKIKAIYRIFLFTLNHVQEV